MVKSASIDGRDVIEREFDPTEQSASKLLITLTDEAAGVEGYVRDVPTASAKNSYVVLQSAMPGDAGRRLPSVLVVRADEDGRFTVRGVRAGRYLVSAIEWLEEGDQFEPAIQEYLRRGAREVVVQESGRVDVAIEVKPGR